MKDAQQQRQVDDQAEDGAAKLNGNAGQTIENSVERAQDGAGADMVDRLLRFVCFYNSEMNIEF